VSEKMVSLADECIRSAGVSGKLWLSPACLTGGCADIGAAKFVLQALIRRAHGCAEQKHRREPMRAGIAQ
jgi:hypothetical protein